MRRLALPLVVLVAAVGPAEAHKLKLFATVEGQSIRGYAFFIGGGRAAGTDYIVTDATGARISTGTTDDKGGFDIALARIPTSDLTVTVDTHEGHIAAATLAATRFGVSGSPPAADPAPDASGTPAGAAGETEAAADARIAALVDAAVQRQIEPLMEQVAAMDSRLRLVDIVSGVFLILGLAGMAGFLRRRK